MSLFILPTKNVNRNCRIRHRNSRVPAPPAPLQAPAANARCRIPGSKRAQPLRAIRHVGLSFLQPASGFIPAQVPPRCAAREQHQGREGRSQLHRSPLQPFTQNRKPLIFSRCALRTAAWGELHLTRRKVRVQQGRAP
jgi:hypothetical protein